MSNSDSDFDSDTPTSLQTDAASTTSSSTPSEDFPGAVLGVYTLIEVLGEGGFGTVWVAEQQQPVRRRVALKILKPGLGSRDVLARFAAERQALALMDHPGIASVLDAGVTPSGRPYFAMELVHGRRITSYADHATLDVRQRLELFRKVCHAVQHAHQKGVVHRDIKPDNVLVAEDDGRPLPRVIDFGIAKALVTPLTEATLQTGAHQIMGTPAYMAPEQAHRSADVDTRADVYSLGALLYELLTGTRPFDLKAKGTTTLEEVLRHIREVDPSPPSQRVAAQADEQARSVAAWRGTTHEKLARSLRGDLDWIVMRALEKDRARRYDTVAALADDVARHLAHEPVEAGPPSNAYRFMKLARRHRGAAVGVAFASVSLLAAVAVLAWSVTRVSEERDTARVARDQEAQARGLEAEARADAEQARDREATARADAEAARDREADARADAENATDRESAARADAEQARDAARVSQLEAEDALAASRQVTAFLADMLSAGDPSELGRDATVRELLDLAAPQIGERFPERPRIEKALRLTVGLTYRALGLLAPAREHLERALALSRALWGDDHPDTLVCRQHLALLDWMENDRARALSEMEDVHARLLAAVGPADERRVEALNVLAIALDAQGRLGDALAAWTEVDQRRTATFGPKHPDTIVARHNVALMETALGDWDAAEAHLRACLTDAREVLGPRHPDTLKVLNSLGNLLSQRGEWMEATPLMEELVAVRREVLGDRHPLTLGSLVNLAASLWQLDRDDQAMAAAREAEAGAREVQGPRGDVTLQALDMLGTLLTERERYDEAEPMVREVYDSRVATLGPDHPDSLISLQNLAALRFDQGRLPEALELSQELVERRTRVSGAEHERTLKARALVARVRYKAGAAALVEPELRELLGICRRVLGERSNWTVDVQADLAWSLLALQRFDEAEQDFLAVYDARGELLGPEHELTLNALEGLARLYTDTGRDTELEAVARKHFGTLQRRAAGPAAAPFDMSQVAWYLCAGPVEALYDPPQALVWAERANQATDYAVPRYLDTLSEARYANGDVQGALDAHRRALSVMEPFAPMRGYHEEVAAALEAQLAGEASEPGAR